MTLVHNIGVSSQWNHVYQCEIFICT